VSLENVFKTVKGKVATAGLAATMSLAASGAALANDINVHKASLGSTQQCAPLEVNKAGRTLDAGLSAYRYSKNDAGAVGISIFPGSNIGSEVAHEFGTKLRTAFQRNGVDAECFVHNEIGPNGTGINFDIDGLSWSEDGPLNIREAKDINTLKGVATEARLVRSKSDQASLAEQYKDADIIIQYGANVQEDVEISTELLVEDGVKAVAVPGLDNPDCAALIYDGEEKARYSLDSIFMGALGSEAEFLIEDGKLSHNGSSDCPEVSAEPQ